MSFLYRWSIWTWSSFWPFISRSFKGFVGLLKHLTSGGSLAKRSLPLDEDVDTNLEAVKLKPSEYPTRFIRYRHIQLKPGMEIPKPQDGEIIYVAKGDFLSKGGTAILERLPSGEVIKTPTPNPFSPIQEEVCRRDMCLEAQIYERIGEHPRVPKFIKWDSDECCLTMEYLENGSLEDYVKENHESITSELRLRWAKQASEGIQLLHSIGVIHCDISPRNFLLDCDLNLKISDFAGSSLSGSESNTCPDARFRYPESNYDIPPRFSDDIFGLGSLIYFIITSNYPYGEVPSDEVEKLYVNQQFPEVTHLTCGDIIERCWHQQVDAAQVQVTASHDPGESGFILLLAFLTKAPSRSGQAQGPTWTCERATDIHSFPILCRTYEMSSLLSSEVPYSSTVTPYISGGNDASSLGGSLQSSQPDGRPILFAGDGARRKSIQFRTEGSEAQLVRRSGSLTSQNRGPPRLQEGKPSRRLPSPPPPSVYQRGVSFDTFDNRDAPDFSFTLNYKHREYECTRRSRTFLCATDQNDYSDFALEWLIDELVDDGDEVVCLRVVEKDSKIASDASMEEGKYRLEAEKLLEQVIHQNSQDEKAISLVMELAVGKVQEIIRRMIQIYEPAVLIVGNRGRSLSGMQSLLPGSVTKYCLQQSPIPVIVVRPSPKREKKKKKRLANPSRRSYNHILQMSEKTGSSLFDTNLSTDSNRVANLPDEEAAAVAAAVGLPPSYNGRERAHSDSKLSISKESISSKSIVDSDNASIGDGITAPSSLESPNAVVLKSPMLGDSESPSVSGIESGEDDGGGPEITVRLEEEKETRENGLETSPKAQSSEDNP
ncbi:hypothetical protein V8E54_000029 [Elaphomyces granulatus]